MNLLNPDDFAIGWKALAKMLVILVKGINSRTIVFPTGGGLDFLEGDDGVQISLSSSGVLNKAGTGSTGGAWLTIDVMDSSCNRKTIQVWARDIPT